MNKARLALKPTVPAPAMFGENPVPKAFDRNSRLWGVDGTVRLSQSHVMVIGLGGVGGFAVEGLARAGVGRLTLIDFDEVCITNVNRQLHAFPSTIGKSKAELLGARVREINKKAEIEPINVFYEASTSRSILDKKPDLIIDCIDNVTAKLHLLAACIVGAIPLITALGASGRIDPTKVRHEELRKTHSDPLAKTIRKNLWRNNKINLKRVSQLIAIFSDEKVILPDPNYRSSLCGTTCVCPNSSNQHHTCAKRNIIWGSAVFVTSVFGMTAASLGVRYLIGDPTINLRPILKIVPEDEPVIVD